MVCSSERQIVWPSRIVSMTVSTGGTFQSAKPVHFLKEQVLRLAGLDCILREIILRLAKQIRTNCTVDGQENIHSVDSIPKCSAATALHIEIENTAGERRFSSNENRKESRLSLDPHGVEPCKPSVVVADYTAFSVKLTVDSVFPDSHLPLVQRLAIRGGQGLGFDNDPMEWKDAIKSVGLSCSTNFACCESSVSVPKTLRGAVVIDSSRRLVAMKSGLLSKEDGDDIRERNCGQAFVSGDVAIDDKDRLQSTGPSESVNLISQEILMSRQKASRALAGPGGGRHLVGMNLGPLSNGKGTDIGEVGCRQASVTDHGSMCSKDCLHSPCPSSGSNLAFHECLASVPTSRVATGSSTARCLASMNPVPSSSGKVVNALDFNCRQHESSSPVDQYSLGREDTTLKRFHVNQAKCTSTADLEGSSVCVAVTVETERQSSVCKSLNSCGTYVVTGQRISSQGLRDCSGGEGLLSLRSEKPEKQVRQELTGDQRKLVFQKAGVGGDLGNMFEGSTSRNNKESFSKRELNKGHLLEEIEVHLIELLEGLARLDENGIFAAPVDNSFVLDGSEVIRSPLCFSALREKIRSRGYRTWRSFVDDFEHMCYSVMNCNEKFSNTWDAANSLLHHGKKYLERYMDKADMFLGLPAKIEQQKGECGLDNGYCKRGTINHEMEHSNSKSNTEYQKAVHLPQAGDICRLPIDDSHRNISGSTLPCSQNMVYIQESEENRSNPEIVSDNMFQAEVQADESLVEILECVGGDIRFDPTQQATECSSSFGDTEFDIDNDSGCKIPDAAEVESELRNGNGAATALGDRKRKKALTLEWKDYRRCIEWRCRWLELQIKELQSQASKYDRILGEIHAKKPWKNEQHSMNNFTMRSAPLIDHIHRNRVLQRKRRKKVENMSDLSSYMSRHPLFSLYEKKKRLEAEEISVDDESNSMRTLTGEGNSSWLDENDFDDHLMGPEIKDGENSVEQLLWNIEALQSRILKIQNHMSKIFLRKSGKYSPKNISNTYSTVECSKSMLQSPAFSPVDHVRLRNSVGGGSKLQPGSNLSRQRNSGYDICNLVMPCNAGATYVEPVRHEYIETPQWRLTNRDMILDQPERGDSSDEVTDEEVYIEYHAVMEVKEKKHRDFPCPSKKLFAGESNFGKGMPKCQASGAIEKDASPASGPESISNGVCLPFDLFVPKRKRKRMQCRLSSIPRVEGMNAFLTEHPNLSSSPQDHDVKENDMNDITM